MLTNVWTAHTNATQMQYASIHPEVTNAIVQEVSKVMELLVQVIYVYSTAENNFVTLSFQYFLTALLTPMSV